VSRVTEREREKVLQKLDEMNIEYTMKEHPAVYTIEEMEHLGVADDVVKNLFLRDAKGKRHFLVVLLKEKQADLKSISDQIGCSRLSFASEDRLQKYLKLTKGSVTPLGILNDPEGLVEVVFDRDLTKTGRLGIHPNDNTATVWMSFDALLGIVKRGASPIHFINL
jgi:Ala-tRNA(Pro) deacylase